MNEPELIPVEEFVNYLTELLGDFKDSWNEDENNPYELPVEDWFDQLDAFLEQINSEEQE